MNSKDEFFRDELLTGPQLGRSVEERLLLSIIDAHPNLPSSAPETHKSAQREKRLREAMKAGGPSKCGDQLAAKGCLAVTRAESTACALGSPARARAIASLVAR